MAAEPLHKGTIKLLPIFSVHFHQHSQTKHLICSELSWHEVIPAVTVTTASHSSLVLENFSFLGILSLLMSA